MRLRSTVWASVEFSVVTKGVTSSTRTCVAVWPTCRTTSIAASCWAWTVRLASYFCMPADSTTRRYGPGKTPGRTNDPGFIRRRSSIHIRGGVG